MHDRQNTGRRKSPLRPLLLIAAAALLTVGCKESVQQSGGGMPSPGGGMPSPGGGMPSPGGGMPSPGGGDSGGESGGSSEGSSGGESGGESGGFPTGTEGGGSAGGFPSGQSGGGSGDGSSSPSRGDSGGGGDVGAIPPPPSQRGGGGGGDGGESGENGDGGSAEDPFADADAEGAGDCGDSGVLPGGVGGMGQAGECIGGGGGASDSDSDAAASAGGAGGGAAGGGTAGAGAVGQFPEETAEERAARLGRELEESIGGFDETLQEEQQDIAAVGRVLEGFDISGGAQGDEESGELVSLGSQRAPVQPGSGGASEGGMVGGSDKEQPAIVGMTQQELEERTPEDIPPAVDDDIIARQLREAALTEDDPVLRERLWDEYRKYRGILRKD